jgi:transposase
MERPIQGTSHRSPYQEEDPNRRAGKKDLSIEAGFLIADHHDMLYIGIDISEATFTASIFRDITTFLLIGKDYTQTKDGFSAFLKDLRAIQKKGEPVLVCMESTGFYGEKLCHYLHDKKQITVWVQAPQHVKRAFGLKGKTDKADSKQIAEYAKRYEDQIKPWTPPPQAVSDMQALITSRQKFKRDEVAHKNRLTSYTHRNGDFKAQQYHQDMIDLCKESLKEIEKEMMDVLKSDPEIFFHAQNLLTIKCIGLHCVSGFLVITKGFRRHDHQKIASLLGFVPRPWESGTSVKKKEKSDRHGHGYLRGMLHLAAKSAVNHDEHFQRYASRLRYPRPPPLH